jgi:hypothetical protein
VDVCTVSLFRQGCPFLASSGGQVERTRLSFYRLYRATCDLAPAPCARGGGTGRRRSGRKCGWRRTAHHYAHRSATRTPRASRAMQQGVATMDTDTSAIAGRDGRFQNGQAHACTRAHSRPIRPVGRGHLRPATRRLSGCTQHIDWHASPSLHRFGDLRELSVPLLSGTGSRFGTGVGEEQTASGAIDRRSPGQPVAVAPCACRLCCVACSKSIACQICAPLGHGPKTATVRWIAAASAPADGLGETGCASPPSAILSHRPSCPRRGHHAGQEIR